MNGCTHWWIIKDEGQAHCRRCDAAREFLTEIIADHRFTQSERQRRREAAGVAVVRKEMGDALDDLA